MIGLEVVAALLVGCVGGALLFSFTIVRRRARRLAALADQLAQATGPEELGRLRYPDRVLTDALQRLATRIATAEAQAAIDPLTLAANRQAALRTLTDEIARANRHERPVAVALIDLDHFKRVNDSHGHAVGDAVLRQVAQLLMANVRSTDTIGRFGGEEFIVILPETDIDGAMTVAEQLRRVVARSEVALDGLTIGVTISIGVTASSGSASIATDAMLGQADSALYNAKAQGRDQVLPHLEPDDEAEIIRTTINSTARRHANAIGRAAFDASNQQLLAALSTRPGWAGGASNLIAELAEDLGHAMGLPDGDVERIRTASLLHDLGKLAIPDEILSKPAPLTPREWRTVIEHPKIGQVVLEQAGAIRDAAAIVLHHHEWFDGRGYPYGLAGGEIPLGSRIVAVADAYEAMISDRPYKAAMTHHEALEELRRHAGEQFDPDLIRLFVELFPRAVPRIRAGRPLGARSL